MKIAKVKMLTRLFLNLCHGMEDSEMATLAHLSALSEREAKVAISESSMPFSMVCTQTCELRSELTGIKCKVGELSSCSGDKRGSSANSGEMGLRNRSVTAILLFCDVYGDISNIRYVYFSARVMPY